MRETDIGTLEYSTKKERVRQMELRKKILDEVSDGNVFLVLSTDTFNYLQTEFNEICSITNRSDEDNEMIDAMYKLKLIPCRLFDIKDELNFFDTEEKAKSFLADLVMNSHKETTNV